MKKFKDLGDWCKWLERNFTNDTLIPKLPVILRLDGVRFSKWTKGLNRPFDEKFSELMEELTKYLVKKTGAVVGYTQSDEITLVLYSAEKEAELYQGGKKYKILSKTTSYAVNFFNEKRKELLPNHNKNADFDCRVYQTPTLYDAVLQLQWREEDATKNSISQLTRAYFSHNETDNKDGSQMQDMLHSVGVNWNDLDSRFKRGIYAMPQVKETKFSADEIDKLPLKHAARSNPNLTVKRKVVERVILPKMTSIKKKVEVIFESAEPIIKD